MLSERDQILFRKGLTYANGYRELEMFNEALAELDALGETLSGQRECRQMRLAVYMQAERWQEALPCANLLAANESSDPGDLVNLAYVTRRAQSLAGARIILENAAKRFPDEAVIHYNLGCYACCNNDLDTAKGYLERAFELDGAFYATSLGDEDLRPIRSWLRKIGSSNTSK